MQSMRGAFQNGLRGLMNLKTRAPRAMAAEKHDSTHGTIEQKGRCQEQSRGCPGQRTRLERAVSGEGGRTSRPCRSRRRCRAPQAVGLEVNGKSLFRQHQQEFVGVTVRQGEGVSPHNVAQASGNILKPHRRMCWRRHRMPPCTSTLHNLLHCSPVLPEWERRALVWARHRAAVQRYHIGRGSTSQTLRSAHLATGPGGSRVPLAPLKGSIVAPP